MRRVWLIILPALALVAGLLMPLQVAQAPTSEALTVCRTKQSRGLDILKAWDIKAHASGYCNGKDVTRFWIHVCIQRRHVRKALPDQWFCVYPSRASNPWPANSGTHEISDTVDCENKDTGGYTSHAGQRKKYRVRSTLTAEKGGHRYVTTYIAPHDRERNKVCGASKPGN